ncbi:CpsD/CapB family tyrosine-protein kinase [Cohnella soli]|uniref:CpsD/CapB family tyrosine-protein kinase n=1 Tax=Cohnella soli TaxID=425005 RepID=A0ABW0HVR2_9BACL
MSTSTVKRSLITQLDPFSIAANEYRSLRNKLDFTPNGQTRKVILVTSAVPLEGKSTTAANLAIAYAQANRKVLLIDGNAYRPALHQVFSVSGDSGAASGSFPYLSLADMAREVGIRNLSLFTAGQFFSVSDNPFHEEAMGSLLVQAREQYDIVIIDSPALLSLTDTSILAVKSDGVLLVVHTSLSRKEQVLKAKKLLEQLQVPIIGCVLNKTKSDSSAAYEHYSTARTKREKL